MARSWEVLSGSPVYSGEKLELISFKPCLTYPRKIPWRLSKSRKANQRKRLKLVDNVIETVEASGVQCNALVSLNLVNLSDVRSVPFYH